MRALLALSAIWLCACAEVIEKERPSVPVVADGRVKDLPAWTKPVANIDSSEDVVFTGVNDCRARFTTNFDNVGIKFNPLDNPNFALQILKDKTVSQLPSFTNVNGVSSDDASSCDALSRVLLPSLFSEQGKTLRNEPSLNIKFAKDVFANVAVDGPALVKPVAVSLNLIHQSVNESIENKNAKTILRTIAIDGSLTCPESFSATCNKARNKSICGSFSLAPPKAKCQLSFPASEIDVGNGQKLKGELGGYVDFSYFDVNGSAYMQIEQIDFK